MKPPSSSSCKYSVVMHDGSQYREPRSATSYSSSMATSPTGASRSAVSSASVVSMDGRGKGAGASVAGAAGAGEEGADGAVIMGITTVADGIDPDSVAAAEAVAGVAAAAAACSFLLAIWHGAPLGVSPELGAEVEECLRRGMRQW